MVPPTFLTIRISLKSTVELWLFEILVTAFTAIGANVLEYCDTIFEFKLVVAARRRDALSLRSTGVDISVRYSTALVAALRKDVAIKEGWMPDKCLVESLWQEKANEPLANSFSAAPNRLPASTTTLVVPSPASMSCAADKSTSWYLSSVCRLERWASTNHLCSRM
jgi:hypothetical protein